MSQALISKMLRKHEGCRLHVYDDATGEPIVAGYTLKGNPTIGYGRLLTDAHGISNAEADMLLAHDMDRVYGALLSRISFFTELSAVRQAVLLDLAHHIGVDGLLSFRRMLAYAEKKNFSAAAREILASKYGKDPRFQSRARRNAEMFESNEADSIYR